MKRMLMFALFFVLSVFLNVSQAEAIDQTTLTKLPVSFFSTTDSFQKLELIEQLSTEKLPTNTDDMIADSDETWNVASE